MCFRTKNKGGDFLTNRDTAQDGIPLYIAIRTAASSAASCNGRNVNDPTISLKNSNTTHSYAVWAGYRISQRSIWWKIQQPLRAGGLRWATQYEWERCRLKHEGKGTHAERRSKWEDDAKGS